MPSFPGEGKGYVNATQAARLMGITARHVYRLIENGYLVARHKNKRRLERLCCKNLRGMLRACNLTFLFSLNSHSKQTGDECYLLSVVSFFYPAYLTFPEHVHRFISLQGSPRSLERKEAHPELDEPFNEAMILLDEVIEIFTLPQFASVWHQPRRFELFERFWIGRVFINGDDARCSPTPCCQVPLESYPG